MSFVPPCYFQREKGAGGKELARLTKDRSSAGATSIRRSAVKTIMNAGYLDIIKGNEGEIQTIHTMAHPLRHVNQQRGVDSDSTLTTEQKAAIVSSLARAERNIVLMTGKADVVSDGTLTFAVENGHEVMGRVTGTGCVLGTTVSVFVAAYDGGSASNGGRLAAVVAALVVFGVAGERAAERAAGPGSFVPAFIDELDRIRRESVSGDMSWLKLARVTRV